MRNSEEKNKKEKQAILERMRIYRQTHGLGCWERVAKKAGRTITSELIRDIFLGLQSPPIDDWRRIDRAITQLSEKEVRNG